MVVCVKSSLLLQLAFGLLCRYSSLLPRMHLRGGEEGEGEEGEEVEYEEEGKRGARRGEGR